MVTKIVPFLCLQFSDNKLVLVGGYNGNTQNNEKYYIEVNITQNFENGEDNNIVRSNKKIKEIEKNDKYIFSNGKTEIFDEINNIFYHVGFDNEYHCHVFQSNNSFHNIYYC